MYLLYDFPREQHSMDLDKTFSSGRFGSTQFGSNVFDPKHLDPHYLQEAPKLAETEQSRTEVLESGKVIIQKSYLFFVHFTFV